MYHLKYDNHYYPVNYTYYGKPVILKATMNKITICDEHNKLICTHSRAYNPFPKYITKKEHDGDYYRRWASAIGSDMAMMIETVLHSSEHEEQSYNSCDGKSHTICNSAARKCIELKSCKYTYFKRMLNKNSGTNESLPEHKNLRGKDYYK